MGNSFSHNRILRGVLTTLLMLVVTVGLWFAGSGCDTYPGQVIGEPTENVRPVVEFANVPADSDTFAYAPVIYWKGRDKDGFVEHYLYADIIDSAAFADPAYYIDFIPDEAWVKTTAMSDTVYLLTEVGQVTQHVFYVKCIDDKGIESEVIYRTFYRTNQPPNIPQVKYWLDADTKFGQNIPVAGDSSTFLADTLYSLPSITTTWSGLGFTWKSNDPDDRDFYTVPLQYRYYLEKVPHDTVWQYVSPNWTSSQTVQFAGLETGHYIFTVWARDDGNATSRKAARAEFNVYQPTFEQSILLLNTTEENGGRNLRWNLDPGAVIGQKFKNWTLPDYPDAEYLLYKPEEGKSLPKAFLGRFRLIIWFSENENNTLEQVPNSRSRVESSLQQYVRIGGKLWITGLTVQNSMVGSGTLALADSRFPNAASRLSTSSGELRGVIPGVKTVPPLWIDTTACGELIRQRYFLGGRINYSVYPLLGGVDIIEGGTKSEAVYYYNSYTDTASGDVWNEGAKVRVAADTINYPPTPVDCIIGLYQNRVLTISRVINWTRTQATGDTVFGEIQTITNNLKLDDAVKRFAIAKVSYKLGEPWQVTDSLQVDYKYQPFSTSHFKPVATRYEDLIFTSSGGIMVNYRIAVFTFPLFWLDDSQGDVKTMYKNMIDWFFWPFAH